MNKVSGVIKPFDSVTILVKCQGLQVGCFRKNLKILTYENNSSQNVALKTNIQEASINLTDYKKIFMKQRIVSCFTNPSRKVFESLKLVIINYFFLKFEN